MKVTPLRLEVSDSIGAVSAELIAPEQLKAIVTLAHGAGAGMNHPFMTALANELAQRNIATLRFNFPFTEQKKKRPDFPAVAHKTIEVAINKAHELLPNVPLFVSGKSFGGRMSSQYLSKSQPDFVKGIIFFGFPLHPPGKPTIDRADHLKEVKVPMLFLQGTKDELATWNLMEQVTNELSLATLYKIDGANHAFKSGKQNLIPVLAQAMDEWIASILASRHL
jgi:predicted alpha/beta-hydrolase family hydrolase